MQLLKEVRDIERFTEILGVLFEEGFEVAIEDVKLSHMIPFTKKVAVGLKPKKERKHEEKLRRTLERLGPTFIKFGQMLSVRPDLLPRHYIKELEKLQDEVRPFAFEQVKSTIEKELQKPLYDIFRSFDKKPIAAASISQVHQAILRTGEKVAVKVQRPNIQKQMFSDIDILRVLARIVEKHFPKTRSYEPLQVVSEFEAWTKKELNFLTEANNAIRFRNNFTNSPTVRIPKVFTDYTTEKILITEFINGIELHKVDELKKKGINVGIALENGFNALLKQVFEDGFFHADPHPGNILVMDDATIAFVDFGIVGHFDDKLKGLAVDMLSGILNQDADSVVETLLELGTTGEVDRDALKEDVREIIDPLQYMKVSEEHLSTIIEELVGLASKHHIQISPSFVLFGKTIVTLEGVALEYDPNFPIIEKARPFLEKLILKRYSPKEQVKSLMQETKKYKRFLQQFPEKATRALETLQRGKVQIHLEDMDINRLSHEIDKSSNRIAYSLVIAGLLIASAFLVQVDRGPFFYGVPFIAFVTFLPAAILGLILVISILKEKY
jgi:ubiquinone biosynthesis protein